MRFFARNSKCLRKTEAPPPTPLYFLSYWLHICAQTQTLGPHLPIHQMHNVESEVTQIPVNLQFPPLLQFCASYVNCHRRLLSKRQCRSNGLLALHIQQICFVHKTNKSTFPTSHRHGYVFAVRSAARNFVHSINKADAKGLSVWRGWSGFDIWNWNHRGGFTDETGSNTHIVRSTWWETVDGALWLKFHPAVFLLRSRNVCGYHLPPIIVRWLLPWYLHCGMIRSSHVDDGWS